MKEEELLQAFGMISPEYVMEAEEEESKKYKGILKYAAIAASLVVVMCSSYGIFRWVQDSGKSDLDYTMVATEDNGKQEEDTVTGQTENAENQTEDETMSDIESAIISINGTLYSYESVGVAEELPGDMEYEGMVEGTYEEVIPEEGIYTSLDLDGAEVYRYGEKAVIVLDDNYYIFKQEK